MKRLGSFMFAIFAATALVISVSAQASLSLWPYFVEVETPNGAPGMYDVVVPLPVMDKAREDLADLRLYDSNNREIPYAVRIRRDVDEKKEIAARLFNVAVVGSATSEVSVDVGENPGEHNEIEIQTAGNNFRRRVEVEGSDTGGDWRSLNNSGTVFRFESQNNAVESSRVSYPTSRYRYLRVRVLRDELTDDQAPRITGVKVMMAVREQGRLSTWNVPVPSYQLLRNQGAYASEWILDLGGRAPCDRLAIEIANDSFSRPFQVESLDDPQNVRLIATGDLVRHVGVDETKPLMITFNEEEQVRKLRLLITDHSNPTLAITSIQASAPARELVFALNEAHVQPLRIFFGSPTVEAPQYDFEKELPPRLANEPVLSTVGQVVANPDYKPEPLPLTERVPWLIYLVLTASSIALALILISLARTALKVRPQETQ